MSTVEEVLAHFGVKGMQWGVRKDTSGSMGTPSTRKQKKVNRAETVASSRKQRIKSLETELGDLIKNGVNSKAMKSKYGGLLTKSDLVFFALHGRSKEAAQAEIQKTLEMAIRDEKFRQRIQEGKLDVLRQSDQLFTEADDVLAHFGVKGMKWGVRRSEAKRASSSDDARAASDAQAKVKKAGGTHVLSNKELQELTTRLNLERQFNSLKPDSKTKAAAKFVADVLVGAGKQQAQKLAQEQIAKQIAGLLKK